MGWGAGRCPEGLFVAFEHAETWNEGEILDEAMHIDKPLKS